MASRAGIVVTGTEVLTGRVTDRNGPWLAEALRRLGVDVAHVVVVGDRPDDLRAALTFLRGAGVDLILTSGGLGPTADDLTAELVARFQGRTMHLDERLHGAISDIIAGFSKGRGWNAEASDVAARKQAMVPDGAAVLAPTGTAPGLVVPPVGDGPPVVVLPGPPRELQGMWADVVEDPTVLAALAGRAELLQRTIRLWGTPESDLTAVMSAHPAEQEGLEITTCLRDGELEIVTRFAPAQQPTYDAFEALVSSTFEATLLSTDGATLDDLVARALVERRLTIGTAESCTAGLVAGRLADRPGSSAYLLGGLVTYSDEAKTTLLGVPADLVRQHGAVSADVAKAMAAGVRERLGSDIGVAVTGVAGPDGGTGTKPVGLVHFAVAGPDGAVVARHHRLPGNREDVRRRSVVVALHLVRRLLDDAPD